MERNIRLTSPTVTICIPSLTNSTICQPKPQQASTSTPASSQGVQSSEQQPPVATKSGEEELPDKEQTDTPDMSVTPQSHTQKVRLLLGERPLPVCQSTCITKPSLHAHRIASGEGSADGSPRGEDIAAPPRGFRVWHPYRQGDTASTSELTTDAADFADMLELCHGSTGPWVRVLMCQGLLQ